MNVLEKQTCLNSATYLNLLTEVVSLIVLEIPMTSPKIHVYVFTKMLKNIGVP